MVNSFECLLPYQLKTFAIYFAKKLYYIYIIFCFEINFIIIILPALCIASFGCMCYLKIRSQFLTVFHSFSQFFTVFYSFSQFFTVFHSFLQFFTVFYSFSQFFTVFHSFSQFFTVFHSFSQFFKKFKVF